MLDINRLQELSDIWFSLDTAHQVAKGKILLAAKAVFLEKDKRARGFKDWYESTLKVSNSSASRYIKLAENEDKVIEAGSVYKAYLDMGIHEPVTPREEKSSPVRGTTSEKSSPGRGTTLEEPEPNATRELHLPEKSGPGLALTSEEQIDPFTGLREDDISNLVNTEWRDTISIAISQLVTVEENIEYIQPTYQLPNTIRIFREYADRLNEVANLLEGRINETDRSGKRLLNK